MKVPSYSGNGCTGYLSKVTNGKIKKHIQPVLIQLAGRILHSDNGGTFTSDNCGTGHISKVTNSKLKKLTQTVLIQFSFVFFAEVMVVLFAQIMVVQDVYLKSLVVILKNSFKLS